MAQRMVSARYVKWLGGVGLIPVSYTHLAVYKRQTMLGPGCRPCHMPPQGGGAEGK